MGSITTEYLYDGGDSYAQFSGTSTTPLRRFVHGASADEPLVVYDGSGTAEKSWLHADEWGSIIAATNASGVATSSVRYRLDGESGTLRERRRALRLSRGLPACEASVDRAVLAELQAAS